MCIYVQYCKVQHADTFQADVNTYFTYFSQGIVFYLFFSIPTKKWACFLSGDTVPKTIQPMPAELFCLRFSWNLDVLLTVGKLTFCILTKIVTLLFYANKWINRLFFIFLYFSGCSSISGISSNGLVYSLYILVVFNILIF